MFLRYKYKWMKSPMASTIASDKDDDVCSATTPQAMQTFRMEKNTLYNLFMKYRYVCNR